MTKPDQSEPPAAAPRRESTHLPLRAGAMLLLSVAVVFIGLGWHSAASGDSDPDAGLEAAQSRQPTSSSVSEAPSPATSAPSTTSTTPRPSPAPAPADPARPEVCIFNAGTISGLGLVYGERLADLGWETATPTNLQSASITENTIFYTPRQRDAAEQLAADLGGDISVDPRPSAFSQCPGGLPLIVVTR